MTVRFPHLRRLTKAIAAPIATGPASVEMDDVEIVLGALRDNPDFMRLIRENGPPTPGTGILKYLDYELYIPDCFRYARMLGMDFLQPLRILDVGTGFGYFPYVCTCLGHEATGLDLDIEPLYNESVRSLGLRRRVHRIERFQPLPAFPQKFHLITAFAICFNRQGYPDVWRQEEWAFFLRDLAANHLSSGGRLFLAMNPADIGGFGLEDLKDFFVSLGARISGPYVSFDDVSPLRAACRP